MTASSEINQQTLDAISKISSDIKNQTIEMVKK